MIVRLFCPTCAVNSARKGAPYKSIPVPIARLNDDGRYEIECELGHRDVVVLDNVKFELLFEMGLNALLDGYPREAVSSFASALERFYEFYWRVVMNHRGIPSQEIDKAWKHVSRQSERQLGMYVVAHLVHVGKSPILLNSDKHVKFRNNVIHKGYVPTDEEAVEFGDSVKDLISGALQELRQTAGEALMNTYTAISPRSTEGTGEPIAITNVLTAVDVRYPPKEEDLRMGGVKSQLARLLRNRAQGDMELLTEDELKKRFPDVARRFEQIVGKRDG